MCCKSCTKSISGGIELKTLLKVIQSKPDLVNVSEGITSRGDNKK